MDGAIEGGQGAGGIGIVGGAEVEETTRTAARFRFGEVTGVGVHM